MSLPSSYFGHWPEVQTKRPNDMPTGHIAMNIHPFVVFAVTAVFDVSGRQTGSIDINAVDPSDLGKICFIGPSFVSFPFLLHYSQYVKFRICELVWVCW